MAKNEPALQHTLLLESRSKMTLSGVKEVVGFSDSEVMLRTTCGNLAVHGKGLNISRLNTDTGELFISGEVSVMKYSKDKKKGSIFEGLFR